MTIDLDSPHRCDLVPGPVGNQDGGDPLSGLFPVCQPLPQHLVHHLKDNVEDQYENDEAAGEGEGTQVLLENVFGQ